MDDLLEKLPGIGILFRRTYTFWRTHIAITNVVHIVFGAGIILALFGKYRRGGLFLLAIVIVMHGVAFLRGK